LEDTLKNRSTDGKKRKKHDHWLIIIALWTIFLSGGFSLFSDTLLRKVNLLVAFIILILVILTGIIFDIIGVAVTTSSITPFNAMAAKKVKGAKTAINLIKNAHKVSSFCNDVIGDVCGIVSGSIGILISEKLVSELPKINSSYITAFIGIIIGALTIVGKAIGKTAAMDENTKITHLVSRVIYFIKKG
jgi:CBS domain containing-hemolysin-like protein